jgi:hypothetical protein
MPEITEYRRAIHAQGVAAQAALDAALKALAEVPRLEARITRKGNLACPYPDCETRNGFVEIDYDMRENEVEVSREDRGTIGYVGQQDSDYQTVAWKCWVCGGLVSLPGEVEVIYG